MGQENIEITRDLTIPQLFYTQEIWKREGRHEREGVWDMAAFHLAGLS
jgi:hypothetical protein